MYLRPAVLRAITNSINVLLSASQMWPYLANRELITLKVILGKCREEKYDLSLDDPRRIVARAHGWRAGRIVVRHRRRDSCALLKHLLLLLHFLRLFFTLTTSQSNTGGYTSQSSGGAGGKTARAGAYVQARYSRTLGYGDLLVGWVGMQGCEEGRSGAHTRE